MRKSREEAAQTRRRIVEAASCEFRKCGIIATGLNDLMKAAGLNSIDGLTTIPTAAGCSPPPRSARSSTRSTRTTSRT